jgi:predicted metal-dependent phosphoesterase TrpH
MVQRAANAVQAKNVFARWALWCRSSGFSASGGTDIHFIPHFPV